VRASKNRWLEVPEQGIKHEIFVGGCGRTSEYERERFGAAKWKWHIQS